MSIIKNKTKSQSYTKKIFRKGIFYRIITLTWIVIIITILIFGFSIIPLQRNSLINRLESEAKSVVTSIGQITATAIITEDYSFVIDHCIKVLNDRPAIIYVVITRKDGFSLVHASGKWSNKQLDGIWKPTLTLPIRGKFIKSKLVNKKLFHYSSPFSYSGIDWGWIHIGLSLNKFNNDLKIVYQRTIWLAVICISIGLLLAYLFAKRLSKPILKLNNIIQRISIGDLSARAEISSGDEIQSLADSFNHMTEALQKSREELIAARDYTTNILLSMYETLFVASPDRVIKTANFAFCKLLGYEEKEIIGQPISKIFRADEIFEGSNRDKLLKKGFISNIETTYITKTGEIIPVIFSASVMRDENNLIQGIVCVAQDISERKRAEKEKEILQKQLIQSSKLSAVGQLASGIAHEFNNILAIIRANIQLLLLEPEINDDYSNVLNLVDNQIIRAARIVSKMIAFAKPKKPEKVISDISEVIDEVLLFQKKIFLLENIKIVKNYSHTNKTSIDKGQMQQVFLNLINNARHAIKHRERGTICISIKEINDNLEIIIRDDGIGMSEKDQKHIFNPFYTTKGARARDNLGIKGTGLGLSVTYSIIQNHYGTINVESEKGKGTVFKITLPIATIVIEKEKKKKIELHGIKSEDIKKLNILIVDDEKEFTDTIVKLFKKLGLNNVVIVNSGKDAITEFNKQTFNIVFLDMLLPDMNGEAILEEIKKINSNIPVIFISGHVELNENILKEKGAFGLIRKPFDINEIHTILKKLTK